MHGRSLAIAECGFPGYVLTTYARYFIIYPDFPSCHCDEDKGCEKSGSFFQVILLAHDRSKGGTSAYP